jgi:predicted ATP-grasp superfamily ATP-dependent carboligase
LSKTEVQNILVVGVDTVSIANSARDAGYKIYAADYFGDVDLRSICNGCEAIVEQKRGKSCGKMGSEFKPETFLKMTKSLIEKYEIDAILLSSGLDDFSNVLYELNDMVPVLGNCPKVIEKARKEPGFFKELGCLGIVHPETSTVENIDGARAAAVQIGYPVIVKPVGGFGGAGIRIARDTGEIEEAFLEVSLIGKNVLVQEFIDGIHASVTFLVANKDVKVLAINEQLLGLRFLFQQEPFGYCGNITPLYFANSIFERCERIAEKIASHFNLKGSNGIDLVISREGTPYVVEVNPRFQATLECVERVVGMNLVQSHIDACLHSRLPIMKRKPSTFCTRLILYTPERIIAPDLTVFPEARDVPFPGVIIERGEPLCSIIAEGKGRIFSFEKAKRSAKSIYNLLHSA